MEKTSFVLIDALYWKAKSLCIIKESGGCQIKASISGAIGAASLGKALKNRQTVTQMLLMDKDAPMAEMPEASFEIRQIYPPIQQCPC